MGDGSLRVKGSEKRDWDAEVSVGAEAALVTRDLSLSGNSGAVTLGLSVKGHPTNDAMEPNSAVYIPGLKLLTSFRPTYQLTGRTGDRFDRGSDVTAAALFTLTGKAGLTAPTAWGLRLGPQIVRRTSSGTSPNMTTNFYWGMRAGLSAGWEGKNTSVMMGLDFSAGTTLLGTAAAPSNALFTLSAGVEVSRSF